MAFWDPITSFATTNIMSNIANNLGLYFFLALIPLIILYLIRPKPKQKTIPSLMFLIKQFQKTTRYSFLRTFLREFLFLVHILLLILLAIAATHPFYETEEAVDAEFSVLIIDNSASANVEEDDTTRFERTIDAAFDAIEGEEVSIILSQTQPVVVLDSGKKSEAIDIINRIEPSSTLSAIGTSMLAAGNLLQEKKGKVVVISDFIHTDSVDPDVAKKSLEAKGHAVEFIDIKEHGENVGIVDVEISDDETKFSVQNFHNESKNVKMTINGEAFNIDIEAEDLERVIFTHSPGLNTVKLLASDDFEDDNTLYVSIPQEISKDILFLSNNEENYILPMLEAYHEAWNEFVEVESGTPPIIPVIDHDIYILSELDEDKLPKAVVKQILKDVEEGDTLIVGMQEDLEDFSYEDELPVNLGNIKEEEVLIFNTNVLSEVTSQISFGKTGSYLRADAEEGATVLAKTETDEPIIVMGNYGEGKVIYYGILDSNSTFHYDISYPLFWQQLIDYIIGKDAVEDLNYKIGDIVLFDNEITVTTPSEEEIKTAELEFTETGVYEYMDKEVAVNLLSKIESQINFDEKDIFGQDIGLDSSQVKTKKSLTMYFIIAFLVFLFLELLYIKVRGDC